MEIKHTTLLAPAIASFTLTARAKDVLLRFLNQA